MRVWRILLICVFGLAVLAGCASSKTTQRQSYADQERLPRPGRVIVYDIAGTPADISATAAITGHYSYRTKPQTEQEIALGRQLGAQVSNGVVRKLLDMGMPAQRAGLGPPPQLGDVLITGQFIMIDEGERGKRVVIGFGEGGGSLRTHIEGYLVTRRGHRLLGTRQIATSGKKSPGLIVPGIVTLATANPAGLIISSVATAVQETGSETLQGAAKRTSDEIAKELRKIFKNKGWI